MGSTFVYARRHPDHGASHQRGTEITISSDTIGKPEVEESVAHNSDPTLKRIEHLHPDERARHGILTLPIGERVQARERHIARADHERDYEVSRARQTLGRAPRRSSNALCSE